MGGNLEVSVLSGSEAAVLCNCDHIFIKFCVPFSVLPLEINSSSPGTRNFSFNLMPKFISISYYTSVFLLLKSSGFTENACARPSELSSYIFLPNLTVALP